LLGNSKCVKFIPSSYILLASNQAKNIVLTFWLFLRLNQFDHHLETKLIVDLANVNLWTRDHLWWMSKPNILQTPSYRDTYPQS